MPLRKFEISDLDICIDLYLDFANAMERGDDDGWTEHAVAERLRGILESPVFSGWVLEENNVTVGFVLGVSLYLRMGRGFDVLELFCAAGRDVRATAASMLKQLAPILKDEGFVRVGVLSNELWTADFFSSHDFLENKDVRLFEFPL